MGRRSRAGDKPVKARRSKAALLKRHNAPKVVRRRSSPTWQEEEIARLSGELNEALEQQTATSEVLQIISSSPGELEPVFQAILENATRICEAKFGIIYRWDGEALRLVAAHDVPPAFAEARRRTPHDLSKRNTLIGGMLETKAPFQVPDATATAGYLDGSDAAAVSAVELGGVRTVLAAGLGRIPHCGLFPSLQSLPMRSAARKRRRGRLAVTTTSPSPTAHANCWPKFVSTCRTDGILLPCRSSPCGTKRRPAMSALMSAIG